MTPTETSERDASSLAEVEPTAAAAAEAEIVAVSIAPVVAMADIVVVVAAAVRGHGWQPMTEVKCRDKALCCSLSPTYCGELFYPAAVVVVAALSWRQQESCSLHSGSSFASRDEARPCKSRYESRLHSLGHACSG
jgi:hypothetical protein